MLALEPGQQIEHLRLHRHIQRGGRFVEEHHFRLDDQCTGNRHPLALPSGGLVRIAETERGVQPDLLQRPHHARLDSIEAVDARRLAQDLMHGVARMQ